MFGLKKKAQKKRVFKVAPSSQHDSTTALMMMPTQVVVQIDDQGLTAQQKLVLRGRSKVVEADSQGEGSIGPPEALWRISDYKTDPKIREEGRYSELHTMPHWAATEGEDRIPIRFRCHWMELQNVDTVNQCFEGKAWIQFKWREWLPQKLATAVSGISDVSESEMNKIVPQSFSWQELKEAGVGSWVPELSFIGTVGPLDMEDKNVRFQHKPGSLYANVFCRYLVRGKFAEKFELRNFPYDYQTLNIRAVIWSLPEAVLGVPLSADYCGQKPICRTVKFETGDNQVYRSNFPQADAWTLKKKLHCKQGLSSRLKNDEGIQYTSININIVLARKCSYYYMNLCFPMFLIGLIAFVTFFFALDDLVNRMNMNVVVILTIVAFRFSLSGYLPITNYLTRLDIYMSIGMTNIFFVSIQSLIVSQVFKSEQYGDVADGTAAAVNKWMGISLAACWILLHCTLPIVHYQMKALNKRLANEVIVPWSQLHRGEEELDIDDEGLDDKVLERSPI